MEIQPARAALRVEQSGHDRVGAIEIPRLREIASNLGVLRRQLRALSDAALELGYPLVAGVGHRARRSRPRGLRFGGGQEVN